MHVFSYLDPGSGSLVIQAIIGGAVAVAVAVKAYWRKIVSLFGKKTSKKSDDIRDEKN